MELVFIVLLSHDAYSTPVLLVLHRDAPWHDVCPPQAVIVSKRWSWFSAHRLRCLFVREILIFTKNKVPMGSFPNLLVNFVFVLGHVEHCDHYKFITPNVQPCLQQPWRTCLQLLSLQSIDQSCIFRVVQVTKSLQDPLEVGNNLPGISDNVREWGLKQKCF